jgi:hypothetical protein
MKRFLGRLILFSVIPMAVLVYAVIQVDGKTDPFYLRFTTPQHESLILGTSRAAQGIQPGVLKSILNEPVFNYSFTIMHSPYGSVYLNSIARKLKPSSDALFILAVDPWCISTRAEDPNDPNLFEEKGKLLDKVRYVSMKPNLDYLLNAFPKPFYRIFEKNSSMELKADGWLSVDVPMDSLSVYKRLESKLAIYREQHLKRFSFSPTRLNYLLQTIELLSQNGEVYLVRLPVHPEMMEIEKELMPDFDRIIQPAVDKSSGYLDLTPYNDNFQYTDGNHLYKESGKEVTRMIGNWILDMRTGVGLN